MNRIKFLSKIALAASVSLALAFTFSCSSNIGDCSEGGCSGGNGSGGSSVTGGADGGGNQFSQIYYAHSDEHDVYHIGEAYKGSGDIKIGVGFKDDYGDMHSIDMDAGSVTNGFVKLNLPKNVPNEYLKAFPDDCTVSPQGIKYAFGGFALTNNNNYVGDLGIIDGSGTIGLWEQIRYGYFSKAGKITCNLSYSNGRILNIYNIDAKAGWNKIYYRSYDTYDTGGDYTSEYSTNNILTKDMKWVLSSD